MSASNILPFCLLSYNQDLIPRCRTQRDVDTFFFFVLSIVIQLEHLTLAPFVIMVNVFLNNAATALGDYISFVKACCPSLCALIAERDPLQLRDGRSSSVICYWFAENVEIYRSFLCLLMQIFFISSLLSNTEVCGRWLRLCCDIFTAVSH